MMHASTSPFYPIIASNEISAGIPMMMPGENAGPGETHGVEIRGGEHFLYCLKQRAS